MRKRIIILLSILVIAAVLAACDANSAAQPAASTTAASAQDSGPAAGRTPGGQRPFGGGTPGGQRSFGGGTPGAQRPFGGGTPGAQRTPGGQRPGGGGTPTATPAATDAAVANAGTAPTAVQAPTIVIPTAIPEAQASNNPATPVSIPTVPAAPKAVVTAPPTAVASTRSQGDLTGKIVFFSDRSGGYPELWVMNADGSNQQLCNCSEVLQTIVDAETVSPDKQQFLYVKTVGGGRGGDIQIWRHNNADNTDEPVTGGAPGFPGVDYDPVWSPDSKHIAWVTEKDRYDEIYLYDATENSNVQLTRSSGEWYKHPSFSPDGSHIAFWSNLGDLNGKQIWVMNLDGSGKVNLSSNSFNDWDPVWVK
jgi:hypothetical protein